MVCCCCRWPGRRILAVLAVVAALYASSLYRDRFKLRSFPFVARTFFHEGWSLDRMPSLKGKVALITGANSGLGLQSARAMHAAGAHVVLACRNPTRCAAAVAELDLAGSAGHTASTAAAASSAATSPASPSASTSFGSAEALTLDLASFDSTAAAARAFLARHRKLDILLLNAGGLFPHALTGDGVETTFQVSHLSHFLLAKLLLPALKRAALPAGASSRLVSVTSDAHQYSYAAGIAGQPDLHSINDASRSNAAQNYAQAKLANVLFTTELNRRLAGEAAAGDGAAGRVYANAAHPGLVATNFIYSFLRRVLGWTEAAARRTDAGLRWVWLRVGLFFDLEGGSTTQLFLACAPEVEEGAGIRGRYYVPVAGEAPFDPHVLNETLAAALWEMSEGIVAPWASGGGETGSL